MGELKAELEEKKRTQDELERLLDALKSRLEQTTVELEAARERMRLDGVHEGAGTGETASLRQKIAGLEEQLADRDRTLAALAGELDSLSYAISHDLRAPIRHVVGFSSALIEDYGDQLQGSGRAFVESIAKAARKIETQVEALLKLSRVGRQELRMGQVDLSDLVRHCAGALQESAPERKARFAIADTAPVLGDAELLRTALESLVENAWKFTSTREVASIEFGRGDKDDTEVFYLRDNGVGFDMRFADRLFGAFQRLHKEGEFAGVGIGLATVQRIIQRHGGRVWAEASVGEGATFYFTLAGDRPDRSS